MIEAHLNATNMTKQQLFKLYNLIYAPNRHKLDKNHIAC